MNNPISGKNGFIQAVTGIIPPEGLGYCQCHEHLFIAKGKSFEINPSLCIDDIDKTIREVELYKQAGGNSIVDAQPVGCGRMAGCLLETSARTGVNVIASTGFHKMIFYPDNHWIYIKDEDFLTRLFVGEIENGMYLDGDETVPAKRTHAKAGIIKVALDCEGISGNYEKLFNAAANASLCTGAPIMCHVEKGSEAFCAIRFFLDKGVDASSIILCHLDRAKFDMEYHREIAETGVYIEYDTIGRFKYHTDEQEIALIRRMVEYGFEGRMLLGLDTTRERLKSYGGGVGLDYIKLVFIPKLVASGIAEEQIRLFMVENPSKALSIKQTL